MLAIFGIISNIMKTVELGETSETVIPQEIIDAVENVEFLESIPLWVIL